MNTPPHKWTDEEVETLKQIYPDTSMDEIKKVLNRTVNQIRRKVRELKIHKSPAFRAAQRRQFASRFVI